MVNLGMRPHVIRPLQLYSVTDMLYNNCAQSRGTPKACTYQSYHSSQCMHACQRRDSPQPLMASQRLE
jgi:hypothetical protein